MGKYQSLWTTPINVELVERQPSEVFDVKDEKSVEIKHLLYHGYVSKVTATTTKKTTEVASNDKENKDTGKTD